MHHARIALIAFVAVSVASLSSPAHAEEEKKEDKKEDEKPAAPPPPKPDDPSAPSGQPGADIKVQDKHEEQTSSTDQGAQSPARQAAQPVSEPPNKADVSDPDRKFTLGGYLEGFYQYNFNNPGNGISNYRGYDTRHNTFTLQNAVLDAGFRAYDLTARIALQTGHLPSTVYGQETRLGGTDGAGPTDDTLWRFLQRASAGWQATKSVLFEAGLFTTSYGVETIAVKDNWNWSRSNQSLRLPNYQTGVKATFSLSEHFDLSTGVFNGWNTVVDNNDEKSISVQGIYKVDKSMTASLAYFGGIERTGGAPEGRPWRHYGEGFVQIDATDALQVAADASGGWEATRFGTHWFAGAALYGRLKMTEHLFGVLRGDRVWEDVAANASGSSSPILFPAKHVTSGTVTLDYRPVKGLSCRLEYRHDRAADDLYFRSSVQGDGSPTSPYVPNTRYQNTATAGVVAYF